MTPADQSPVDETPLESSLLEISDLHVEVDESERREVGNPPTSERGEGPGGPPNWAESGNRSAEILRGVSLVVAEGELHALMGPNGSGKSTLAKTLLADPGYRVTEGTIRFKDEDVTALGPAARAARGMFLGFQHPEAISGVSVLNFLRQAMANRKGIADFSVLEVRMALLQWSQRLGMDDRFVGRYLNEGFSGGERKRNEILQMALLQPDFAVLDETDSGLDIDALGDVAVGIDEVRADRPALGILLITHYQRILHHLTPDRVHVLVDGRIATSGGPEVARLVEAEGFEAVREGAAA